MGRYLGRKGLIYALTLFVAVTINWMLPRFMPGDPISDMVSRAGLRDPEAAARMQAYYENLFGLDVPIWQQYLNYWGSLFSWPPDLGISMWSFPRPVGDLVMGALPYTLALLIPAILLSWYVGNKLGALAARRKALDNTVLPVSYLLTATPYMWLAILLVWFGGMQLGWFPSSRAYSGNLVPEFSMSFIGSLALHWVLPFLSLFLVALGGWAIGMRNLVIYELESDYSNYLGALGAPPRLIRKYAFRNAMLPQITGLALQLGVVLTGNIVTEVVFNYPGLGLLLLNAITSTDFFLLQGIVLFVVIGVLICNFVIDIVYVWVDPRTRTGLQGASA
ncbi:ABC transporter permease [Actinobacteria bacterium YIM 96077]|uniref:ABC transporter permease n=1 Tax=Phytoactinopolyspora halophila TaxID=1981511 RepID=A0A329QHS2_9ACTN|nr:ABC transporter permease [Phytoactinopolyspora halophila]AYY13459.1 ABC transporter permease [Actinobacteria bacterium YIM 96077]RAW10852.1 ABC transporter permease [Phytoactinopolyspora halophila]